MERTSNRTTNKRTARRKTSTNQKHNNDTTRATRKNSKSIPTNHLRQTQPLMDNSKYYAGLYVIYDKVSQQILGPVALHKHDAAAIRSFTDVASLQNSIVGKHPHDFELCRLGYLTHSAHIEGTHAVILTGEQWLNSQQAADA